MLAACVVATVVALLGGGCGVYTFSGSTLPGYLRTVEIPLFANRTLQPGVAEEITSELNTKVLGANLLRVVPRDGDASLSGEVRGYLNEEYQYDIKGERRVDVTEYVVRIAVYVEFFDRKKGKPLYSGMVEGEGVYAFGSEQETQGRQRAVEDVVRQILENSVQGW